ncbi:hypothetical protein [Aeromonas salmonicida]|uniref:hypothetical protein n=1 Tax=Aeromonas salmonicida TaxID=645 RepID=UPI000F7A9D39|nr:hypothetical protein [Aeromonas salmonicida]RSM24977.1 hypothetical protein C5B77_19470 [Aeromonas salmonicida]
MIKQARYDFLIYRGDTPKWTIQLKDVNDETGVESEVDITNFTITGQCRYSADSSDILFNLPIVKKDPKKGIIEIVITKQQSEMLLPVGSTQSSESVYDIQMTVGTSVWTFLSGGMSIIRDITRTQ